MVVGFITTYVISAYHHWSCEFESRLRRVVLYTTLYDKVCQWFATDLWFSPSTPVSSTTKTDNDDITEYFELFILVIVLSVLLWFTTASDYTFGIFKLFLCNIKKYYSNFDQLDFFSQLKIIFIPDQEFLPSVVDYIKQSLELRKWGSHWSMYNFNYEYMTFLYVVHVYICFVMLYCIVLLYPQGFYLQ